MSSQVNYAGQGSLLPSALLTALDNAGKVAATAAVYHDDPAGFIQDCIDWPEGMGPTEYQLDILRSLVDHKRVCVRAPHSVGKDLSVETPIPTPDGWKSMGDLVAGDVIFDERGAPCTVLYADVPQEREAHHVVFGDGASIVAGAGHLWNAIDVYDRPKGVHDWRDAWDATKTFETWQIASKLHSRGGQLRWRVPTARPVEAPEVDLPIDPYVFGYWLGDGGSRGARLTVGEPDREHVEAELVGAGYSLGAWTLKPKTTTWELGFKLPRTRRKDGLRPRLRALGVLGDKHIPGVYLRASVEQRRALVQGLWDSDGYRNNGGSDEITLTNGLLAENVGELLKSLGLSARTSESAAKFEGREVGRRWRIRARFDFRPYRMKRYDWTPIGGLHASRTTQRTIVSAVSVGRCLTRCIAVDSPSRLFLAGRDFVPTHNSATNAWACLWFAFTRDAAKEDWKIVTTAFSWTQLSAFLWPEIHKWARLLNWEKIGRKPPNPQTELMQQSLRLDTGRAVAASCENPMAIEGAHADELFFVYDEAKGITAPLFDATEGAFAGAGKGTRQNAYALASSTPGEPQGRFYEICVHKPGLEGWHTFHITLERAIESGQVSPEWAEERRVQWMEDARYKNRVLGEFAASDEDGVIKLSWIEEANERWKILEAAGWPEMGNMSGIGVDVGEQGDRSVIAKRYGHVIKELTVLPRQDPMATAGAVLAALRGVREGHPWAVIDAIGIGSPVVARLREQGVNVFGFVASEGCSNLDRAGEYGFTAKRSAAWWNLREMLEPSCGEPGDPGYHEGSQIALPPDDRLTGDLLAPKYRPTSGGKLQIETKLDIKKRIGRSTDAGDAVVMAFWQDAGVTVHAPIFGFGESRWAPMRQDIGTGGGGMFG